MHAARALQQQRQRREARKDPLARRLERNNSKHVSSGSLSTINNWYLERMEERQAAVIAARKRARGLNLSHVFAIMALVGAVFILVSLFITVVALLEVGVVILIVGIIFTVCCHFEGGDMIDFDDTFNPPMEGNDEPPDGEERERAKNLSEAQNGEVLDVKKESGPQISPSRFVIEIIPEEPEDYENDNDNENQPSAENVTIEIQESINKRETTNTYEQTKEDVRVTIITKGSESIVEVVKDSQIHANNEMAS